MRRYLLSIVFLAEIAAAGDSTHTGDPVCLILARARAQAATDVTNATRDSLTKELDERLAQFVVEKKTELSEDILAVEHNCSVHEGQRSCAIATDEGLKLSIPHCRRSIRSNSDAVEILIHESLHRVGIESEDEANRISIALHSRVRGYIDLELGDFWLDMNIDTGLENRRDHHMLWTGSHLVVWGGSTGRFSPYSFVHSDNEKRLLYDGAIYDPTSDSWTKISEQGAPQQFIKRMIWTGEEILFEGSDRRVEYAYNIGTSSWHDLSDSNLQLPTHVSMIYGQLHAVIDGRIQTFDAKGRRWVPLELDLRGIDPRAEYRVSELSNESGSSLVVWTFFGSDLHMFTMDINSDYELIVSDASLLASSKSGRMPAYDFIYWTGSKVLIYGGVGGVGEDSDPNRFNSMGAIFDPSTKTWESIPESPYPALNRHKQGFVVGNSFIVAGEHWYGQMGTRIISHEPMALDLETLEWRIIDPIRGSDLGTRSDRFVNTGDYLIYWGGDSQDTDWGGSLYFP